MRTVLFVTVACGVVFLTALGWFAASKWEVCEEKLTTCECPSLNQE